MPNTLSTKLKEKSASNQKFSRKEMSELLSGSVSGLAELQSHGILHEKLAPESIGFTNDGQVKILDPLSMPILPNYDRVLVAHQSDRIYLSPEQC